MKKSLLISFLFFGLQAFSQTSKPVEIVPGKVLVQVKVPATVEQLTGKWSIVKVEKPNHTEIPAEQISGSYFIFNPDQTYTAKIINADEKGTWAQNPDKTSVLLTVDFQKTIWNVLKIGESELVMQKGVRGNKVTFSKN